MTTQRDKPAQHEQGLNLNLMSALPDWSTKEKTKLATKHKRSPWIVVISI